MSAVFPVNSPPSNLPHSGCPNCGFIAWCLPASLTSHEAKQFNDRIVHCRPIKRHEYLHRAGAVLTSLNVINSGFLKTSITDGGGHQQITGFSMSGELVGMDAISASKHQCDTVALEDSHLCGITFSDFQYLARDIPALQRHFHRMMGAEIARDYGVMLLLGSMHAEERVAIFLLNLSKRFTARGYSGLRFRLPMSRQEIGNYLGLKLETVSRVFSRFHDIQLIAISGKEIEIKSIVQLQQIIKN
jgi:CRP/FNR family transcriptional regulator, anaerobic regulatory protein